MIDQLLAIDKVSIVALAKDIEKKENTTTISQLAGKYQVALMSEARNRRQLIEKIKAPVAEKPNQPCFHLIKKIILFLMVRSMACSDNTARRSYALWFKLFIMEIKDEGMSYQEIHDLTDISMDTLSGFREAAKEMPMKQPMSSEDETLAQIWQQTPSYYRSTLDLFWRYLGRTQPDLKISYNCLREKLINLGLHRPRGPHMPDHGTHVKQPFCPHAIWEGDGKLMKICINNELFTFNWYAFIDQHITLLVGSTVERTESAASFLNALKDAKIKHDLEPIGVLIDNRFGESDLSAVHHFCRKHGITVIHTFPGTPKTNGTIENNFGIFERYIGPIHIVGQSKQQIAAAIARNIVEIFTQLRNHTPRHRLGGLSPADADSGERATARQKSEIERLAERLKKQHIDLEEKWLLIAPARFHFEPIDEKSEEKIKKILSFYSSLDIVTAQAKYLAQIAKNPDKKYRSEYFFAILRYTCEERSKQVYNETFRAGYEHLIELMDEKPSLQSSEQSAENVVAELVRVIDLPSPAHQMLALDAICWWLVSYLFHDSLYELWLSIETLARKNRALTHKYWLWMHSYITERIGDILYSGDQYGEEKISEMKNFFEVSRDTPYNLGLNS